MPAFRPQNNGATFRASEVDATIQTLALAEWNYETQFAPVRRLIVGSP